ncbi:MAG: hypothetical protein COB90_02830 [Hyphomicrobiales bacterium]|nr:MAG: hypothetical protein COB90_02830 [Hyphomicrobiales bacterium]
MLYFLLNAVTCPFLVRKALNKGQATFLIKSQIVYIVTSCRSFDARPLLFWINTGNSRASCDNEVIK